jgi:hypothetical protein
VIRSAPPVRDFMGLPTVRDFTGSNIGGRADSFRAEVGLIVGRNDHKVRGMQINYKSAEKYVGSDELELLVLFPNGFAWEVHYNIDVR